MLKERIAEWREAVEEAAVELKTLALAVELLSGVDVCRRRES